MKQSHLLCSLFFLIGGVSASASPIPDVPTGHWAVPAVRSVVQKKIMAVQPGGGFQGSKTVTRYELAVALDRFIRYIEAGRKPLNVSATRTGVALPVGADPTVRSAIKRLSTNGFLPPTSPVFHGEGNEPVTAQQLSDALAAITIRLSDRSLPPAQD